MKVTELYYLIENLRYILLSEHIYFPAISPFLSDWVTYIKHALTLILTACDSCLLPILGPLLFIIYVNDLPDVVLYSKTLFADDTKCFMHIREHNDTNLLQNDVVNFLFNWNTTSHLSFHLYKNCHLPFSLKFSVNNIYH